MCVCHVNSSMYWPNGDIRTLRTGVRHDCVLPDMGIERAADGLTIKATTPACMVSQDVPFFFFIPTLILNAMSS